jgi:hypothetical protein
MRLGVFFLPKTLKDGEIENFMQRLVCWGAAVSLPTGWRAVPVSWQFVGNDQCRALSRFAPRDPFSPYATQVIDRKKKGEDHGSSANAQPILCCR